MRLPLVAMLAAGLVSPAVVLAQPAPAAPAATPVVDRMDETVCRKDRETGSLVKSKKTCHTRRQWQYIDDTNQNFGRNLIDENRSRPGGN